jgi:hypothetical protein
LSFVTFSLVDKVSKLCEGLSILNSLFIDMNTRHKKDKIPLDGNAIAYDFHKYHALGNDVIAVKRVFPFVLMMITYRVVRSREH